MSTTSRATIRDAVAAMLITALTGVGKPVQTVYAYQRSQLGGASPIVTVTSGGTERRAIAYGEDMPRFYLTLTTFVLHSDPAASWTEANAEAKLDEVEALISATLIANQETATWQNIQYAARSTVETVMSLDGFVYRREMTPILVECESDT